MSLIKCLNCGENIESTEKFCYYCGEGLNEQNAQIIPTSNLEVDGTSDVEVEDTSNKGKAGLVICSIISYIIAIVFVGLGFNKMFAYNSGEYFGDPVNAYVGGDAYNYIINANYATAYFALATLCCIVGATFIFSYLLVKSRK